VVVGVNLEILLAPFTAWLLLTTNRPTDPSPGEAAFMGLFWFIVLPFLGLCWLGRRYADWIEDHVPPEKRR
jgi:apolipoprotein N-acyltransferase